MADVTITYDGNKIVELSESATKTLQTSGKYCTDNIKLKYVRPSGAGVDLSAVNVYVFDYASDEYVIRKGAADYYERYTIGG